MLQLQDPQYKTPDGAALRIWRDAAPNRFLTEKLGRPIFDDVIYCEVIAPGSGNSTPVFEVERMFDENMKYVDESTGQPKPLRGAKYDELKQFIDDFKKNENGWDSTLAGTPLEQWPEMNRSLVATLKAQGVFTVDALAVLPDGKLTIVGPDGRSWREKAKACLENAKGNAYATNLAAENGTLKISLEDSKRREGELAARIAQLEAAKTGTAVVASTPKEKTVADAVAEIVAAQAAPIATAGPGETLVAAKAPEAMPII